MKLAKLGNGPEIFHTIQGEGVTAGCPAVFIRTSRCNLHCIWCDTDHTWNFEGTPWPHLKDGQEGYTKFDKDAVTYEIRPQEAAAQILAFDCPRVVITGGEPLLQETECLALIRAIREERPEVVFEIETNGTLRPSADMAVAIDQFNVSPKLANSGMDTALRIKPAALETLVAHPNSWFKFVVTRPEDLEEIEDLARDHQLPTERILLMPEGRDNATLDQRAIWLAERCRDKGFRYGERLHVRLWGDRRGV
ncbi:MAG: 7-carboxy-7-deazaguanine synthase QueE [Akkermansiaceae bacterium]|nr:7-carboxy-7-deazaguanine synthase QueE [Akkermansiaceae bacterium]